MKKLLYVLILLFSLLHAIPKLGTGKADFKGAKRLALELVG